MKLYLDCEFNGFLGDLISMALVDEDGREWYETLPCENPNPWVIDNVIPILQKEPIPFQQFQKKLLSFLKIYSSLHIIADWPEDIALFCNSLITGPGTRLVTPHLMFEIHQPSVNESQLPHNALADARALRQAITSIK